MSEYKTAFLSYNRSDSLAFAARLYQYIQQHGLSAWFDYVNIESGEDYLKHIQHGIRNAQNFVFVMAPGSVGSPYCMAELTYAIEHGKRIVPILHQDLSYGQHDLLPPEASMPDWISVKQIEHDTLNTTLKAHINNLGLQAVRVQELIEESKQFDQDDIDVALSELKLVLEKDKDITHWHSQLLYKSLKWQAEHFNTQYLLVGKEKKHAQKQFLKIAKREFPPFITDLQAEYVCESRKNGEGMLTDVFITYSREDINLVDQFDAALQKQLVTNWIDRRDIAKGQEYYTEIQYGVENADNFIYLISPDSAQSEWCLKELEYAQELNKRIIPILLQPTNDKELPPQIGKTQYINLGGDPENIHLVLSLLKREREYLHQHKILLVQALKWERQRANEATLLRGRRLEQALEWLTASKTKKIYAPTSLHKKFIAESDAKKGQIGSEVFISYSRADGDFARYLNDSLQVNGHTTWFDQESLAAGATNFWAEIQRGIRNSDNFVFIISPDSTESEYCKREVDLALADRKRIITLNYRSADIERLKEVGLSDIQWINFENKCDYTSPLGELSRGLSTDREYIEQHTRWGLKARQWEEYKRDKGQLLSGRELSEEAMPWLQKSLDEKKQPSPTALQEEFIKTSKKERQKYKLKSIRLRAEVRHLEKDKENAILDQIKSQQRAIRRQRIYTRSAVIGIIVIGFFAFYMIKLQKDNSSKKSQISGLIDSLQDTKETITLKKQVIINLNSTLNQKTDSISVLSEQKKIGYASLRFFTHGNIDSARNVLTHKGDQLYKLNHFDSAAYAYLLADKWESATLSNPLKQKFEESKFAGKLLETAETLNLKYEDELASFYYQQLLSKDTDKEQHIEVLKLLDPFYEKTSIRLNSETSVELSKQLITNEQYARFLNSPKNKKSRFQVRLLYFGASSYKLIKSVSKPKRMWIVEQGYEKFPAVNITRTGAQAYCDANGYLLPSESELSSSINSLSRNTYTDYPISKFRESVINSKQEILRLNKSNTNIVKQATYEWVLDNGKKINSKESIEKRMSIYMKLGKTYRPKRKQRYANVGFRVARRKIN